MGHQAYISQVPVEFLSFFKQRPVLIPDRSKSNQNANYYPEILMSRFVMNLWSRTVHTMASYDGVSFWAVFIPLALTVGHLIALQKKKHLIHLQYTLAVVELPSNTSKAKRIIAGEVYCQTPWNARTFTCPNKQHDFKRD